MEQVDKIEAVSMVENHLVSPDFISNPKGRGLLLSKDNSIAIMINEEDHLRIQVMKEGIGAAGRKKQNRINLSNT